MSSPVATNQRTRNLDKYEAGGVQGWLVARFRRALLEGLRALEPAPASVLDAGCGEGVVTDWLAGALPGASVTGLDAREEALAELRARVPGARAVPGDVYALPFADGEFDLVVATELLEHLERPVDAVAELARVCRRHLLATVPHEPWFRAGNIARGRYLGRLGSTPGHVNTWSRRGFLATVEPAVGRVRWRSCFPWQMAIAEAAA